MQAVKWVVAKLQGDKTASFCRESEWSRSYREINQHPNLPWNFITHGFLDPSTFPEKKRPCRARLGWCRTSTLHCIDHTIVSRHRGRRSYNVVSRATLGPKKQRKLFLYKVFQKPFGSWTSAPKIVDVRAKKWVFLRPRRWGEAF